MAHPSHWEHPDYKKLVYIVAIGMDVNEHAAKSWEHFAKRHDCDFKVITESSNPSMAPHWERYTVMERFPEYNQYLLVLKYHQERGLQLLGCFLLY